MEAELVVSLSVPVLSSFHPNACFQLTFMFSPKIRLRPSTLHQWRRISPTRPLHRGVRTDLCWVVLLGRSYRADLLGVWGQAGTHVGRFPWSITHACCWSVSTARRQQLGTKDKELRHLKKRRSLWWKFSPRFLWFCMCLSFESVSLNG